MSRIMCFLFTIASFSHCYISITLCYAYAIVCTSMVCCTFNCTSVNSCSSFATTVSSLVSFCIVCASTKCYSLTSSFFDSSMHTSSQLCLFFLHVDFFCLCTNNQLQMFQFYIYHELLFAQIASSHYTFFLLHILKMMMNVITTSHQWLNIQHAFSLCSFQLLFYFCSSQQFHFLFLLSSMFTPLRFLFLYYSLQFFNHSLHSCYYEVQNFENIHNFQQQK